MLPVSRNCVGSVGSRGRFENRKLAMASGAALPAVPVAVSSRGGEKTYDPLTPKCRSDWLSLTGTYTRRMTVADCWPLPGTLFAGPVTQALPYQCWPQLLRPKAARGSPASRLLVMKSIDGRSLNVMSAELTAVAKPLSTSVYPATRATCENPVYASEAVRIWPVTTFEPTRVPVVWVFDVLMLPNSVTNA